jgi:hypothetical protein
VAGAVGAFLFAWSGFYNVAATSGHWAVTNWFLHCGMRNSVFEEADRRAYQALALYYSAPPLPQSAAAD